MTASHLATSRSAPVRSTYRARNLALRTTYGPPLAVLALSLVVRLVWVMLVPNGQYSDSVWYDGAARNLAAGLGYGPDGPSAWFPPGYPFLLALTYKLVGYAQFAGKLDNVLIGLGLTACTYLLGRTLAGPSVGLLAALFVACWPNLIFHTGILSSDLLAAFGFAAVMWLGTLRPTRTRAVGIGLLVGWMILVRPVSGILLGGLGLLWWRRHELRQLVPVVLIAAVVVGCWTVRNYATFGEPVLIATNGGYNFWQVNQRYADGNDTFWQNVPLDDPEYKTMREGDELTRNREGYRYGLAYIRAYPERFFELIPAKLFWLYHTDTSGLYEGALYPPMLGPSPVQDWLAQHEGLVESATFRYYEVLVVLAIGAAIGVIVTRQMALLPIVALPLLLTFFHFFFHAKDRFHVPLAPMIAILAALALVKLWSLRTRVRV